MIKLGQWGGVAAASILMYKFIIKQDLIGVINQNLEPEEAGLLRGILWGDQKGIGREMKNNLINSGLYHLVVASGTNVMLLSSLVIENLAKFLGRKKTIGLVLGLVWWYAAEVGWQIPIIRAAIMASGLYAAQLLGRRYEAGRMLLAAGLLMLVCGDMVWQEISFWLSMSAMGGMLTFKEGKNRWWTEFKRSIWVSIWVMPVLALSVGKVSWIGPISNMLVIEAVRGASVIGGIAMAFGGQMLLLVYPLLKYLGWVAERLGRGGGNLVFNWWMAAGWYAILLGIIWKREGRKNEN